MADLFCLHLTCDAAAMPAAETCCELNDLNAVVWIEADTGRSRLDLYFDTRGEAETWAQRFAEWIDGAGTAIDIETVRDRDWSESWKDHFHPLRASERIVVTPSWESVSAASGDCVIQLDPGMSFGTGQHPTTQACLQFIDCLAQAAPPGSLLDWGTGSGILAIAAVKLGIPDVVALDNDTVAVECARANARANGAADGIRFGVADLSQWEVPRRYDVVVANILADVLVANAQRLADAVAANGHLIVSGILDTQFAGVCDAFAARGMRCGESLTIGEWTSGVLRFSPPRPTTVGAEQEAKPASPEASPRSRSRRSS